MEATSCVSKWYNDVIPFGGKKNTELSFGFGDVDQTGIIAWSMKIPDSHGC